MLDVILARSGHQKRDMKIPRFFPGLLLLIQTNSTFAQQSGSIDMSFNPGASTGGAGYYVFSLAICTNGQVLIGGNFNTFNGQSRNFVARLNSDGSLDNSFLPLQGPSDAVYAIAPDSSGNIYIGGNFLTYDGIARTYFARLRSDASLDLSWQSSAFNGIVNGISIQGDGTILIQGAFNQIGATKRNGVAKLNTDATVNFSFNPAAGVTNGSVLDYAIQPDGNVIIVGNFDTNNPVSRQFVARVSQSGVLDSSFNAGFIGGGPIQVVVLQPDGKLIVGGTFTSINGYSRIGIARLNMDGSVDTGFYLAPGISNPSFGAMNVLPNGEVLLAGGFSVGGNYGLLEVKPDGSLDSGFNAHSNDRVQAVAVQPDGKFLVGGYFTSIGGTNIYGIARLNGSGTNVAGFQFLTVNRYAGMLLSGIVSNNYRLESTTNLNTPSMWTPLFDFTLQTNPQLIIDPAPISGKQRYYRAVGL